MARHQREHRQRVDRHHRALEYLPKSYNLSIVDGGAARTRAKVPLAVCETWSDVDVTLPEDGETRDREAYHFMARTQM
jgi:hypothetical protein